MKGEPDNARKQGSLMSHYITVSKMSITDMETGKGNFVAATPLGIRRPRIKERL